MHVQFDDVDKTRECNVHVASWQGTQEDNNAAAFPNELPLYSPVTP